MSHSDPPPVPSNNHHKIKSTNGARASVSLPLFLYFVQLAKKIVIKYFYCYVVNLLYLLTLLLMYRFENSTVTETFCISQ